MAHRWSSKHLSKDDLAIDNTKIATMFKMHNDGLESDSIVILRTKLHKASVVKEIPCYNKDIFSWIKFHWRVIKSTSK
jgi:hypothetical protein